MAAACCAGCSLGEHVLHADLAAAGEREPRLHAQRRGAEGALVPLQHREQGHVGEERREQLVLDDAEAEDALARRAASAA